MYSILITLLIVSIVSANIAEQYTNRKKYILNKTLFKIYQTEFNKNYNRLEYYNKLNNFIQNTQLIDLNKNNVHRTWCAGWTSISDMFLDDLNNNIFKFPYQYDTMIDLYEYDHSQQLDDDTVDLITYNYEKFVDYDFNYQKKVKIEKGDIGGVLHAISNTGPIVTQLYFNQELINYDFGIYSYSNPDDLNKTPNQPVVIVGYAKDYFILLNSWGNKWGMNGYMIWNRTELEQLITHNSYLYI